MKYSIEIWMDIPNYEGYYQVSSFGRVKSIERHRKGKNNSLVPVKERIIEFSVDKDGYYKCVLSKDTKKSTLRVSRIVAIAFILNPNNYLQVNHINGIRDDNCVDNLEWCNEMQNKKHRKAILQSYKYGENHPLSKLRKHDILNIRSIYKKGVPQKEIASAFGISQSQVSNIITEFHWKN
jgi:hypothetical protein